MKRLLFFVLACILLVSCNNKQNQFVIEGDLTNAKDGLVRLALVDADDMVMLDSVKLKDGHFEFVVKAESDMEKNRLASPMLYQIILSYDNTMTTLAQGGDHITIQADAKDMITTYHVQGSEEAVLMGQLDSALTSFVKPAEEMYEVYMNNVENDSVREGIEQKYLEMLKNHKAYLTNFIKQHPNNMASYIAFYQNYNRRSFFTEDEDYDILRTLTMSLKEKYPNNPYIKNMVQRIEVLDVMKQKQ